VARRPPFVRRPSGRGISRLSCAERRSWPDLRSAGVAFFFTLDRATVFTLDRATVFTLDRATSSMSLVPPQMDNFSSACIVRLAGSARSGVRPSVRLARADETDKLDRASEAWS